MMASAILMIAECDGWTKDTGL